jgi:hypothetical protein
MSDGETGIGQLSRPEAEQQATMIKVDCISTNISKIGRSENVEVKLQNWKKPV